MHLFDEFHSIVREFRRHRIQYAVVGGIAMAFHGEPRFTRDIDVLIEPRDLGRATAILKSLRYSPSAPPWTFPKTNLTLHRFLKTEATDYLVIDILVGQEPRHHEIIKNCLREKSGEGTIRIARMEDIIWMKQFRDSEQDQVDIKRLQNDQD